MQLQSIGLWINIPSSNMHVHMANRIDLDPTGGLQ